MSARILKWAVLLFAFSTVASVAYSGAKLTWHLMGITPEIVPAPVARIAKPETEPLNIQPILALAPFGTRFVETAQVVETPDAPAIPILHGLSLQGVMVAAPSSRSLALIAGVDGKVQTYTVGAEVARGAVLETVRSDSVDIVLGEHRDTLRFEDKSQSPADVLAKLRQQIPATNRATVAKNAKPTPEELIDLYRKRIAINPKAVLDGFGVSVTEQGYRIGSNPSTDVTRAGLRPGDVIAKVNGEQVGNIEVDRRLYEKIAASGHARVEILRDGRRVILSFPLR